MLILIEYATDGRIVSVAGAPAGADAERLNGRAVRIFDPHSHVLEFDATEMRHERDFDGLLRFMHGHSVVGNPEAPRVVPRESGSRQ